MPNENQIILLDVGAVKRTTGYRSATSIYTLMAEHGFPKPISIGRTKRWIESEIQAWIADRVTSERGGNSHA